MLSYSLYFHSVVLEETDILVTNERKSVEIYKNLPKK